MAVTLHTQNALMGLPMGIIAAAYFAVTKQPSLNSKSQMVAALARAVDSGQITIADVRRLGQAQAAAPITAAVNKPEPAAQAPTPSPGAVRLAAQVGAVELEVSGLKGSMSTVAAEIQSLDQRIASLGQQQAGANARLGLLGSDVAALAGRVETASTAAQAEAKSLRAQVQTLADGLGQIQINPDEVAKAIRAQVEAAFAPIAAAAEANETSSEVLRVAQAGPTGHASALDLFGLDLSDVKGAPLMFATYDHPEAPAADPCFIWQESIVRHLHIAQANGRNLWLGGPAGTGKTQTMQQFAARTGRMFRRFVFDRFTTRDDFLGATGLDNGSTVFQPGPVLEAYTTPGAVCLLDEVGMGQPAALSALNAFLERQAQVAYAGQVWHRAPGTMFPAADNSLGQGDTSGRFAGVQTMNTAFLERFSLLVPFAYLPASLETEALVRHTGCTAALAAHVVDAVGHIRGRVAGGEIIDAPSIRQMVAFVEACRVLDPAEAWRSTIGARQPAESEAGMAAAYAACINESLIRNESQKV
jgi:cobaltochelatase CobS